MSKNYLMDPYQIRGFPGYRVRPNRCGLDPMDTYAEEGFMRGLFIRYLFTLKLRTRNPIYLFAMFIFGFIPFIFLFIIVYGLFLNQEAFDWIFWLWFILLLLVPGLLAIKSQPRDTFFRYLRNLWPRKEKPVSLDLIFFLGVIFLVLGEVFLIFFAFESVYFSGLILLVFTGLLALNFILSILDLVRSRRSGQ
jgi:hypothetical protein